MTVVSAAYLIMDLEVWMNLQSCVISVKSRGLNKQPNGVPDG